MAPVSRRHTDQREQWWLWRGLGERGLASGRPLGLHPGSQIIQQLPILIPQTGSREFCVLPPLSQPSLQLRWSCLPIKTFPALHLLSRSPLGYSGWEQLLLCCMPGPVLSSGEHSTTKADPRFCRGEFWGVCIAVETCQSCLLRGLPSSYRRWHRC